MSSSLSTVGITAPPLTFEDLNYNFKIMKELPVGEAVYINKNRFEVEDRYLSGIRRGLNGWGLGYGFDLTDVERLLGDVAKSIEYYKDNLPARHVPGEFTQSIKDFSQGWGNLCVNYYRPKKGGGEKAKKLEDLFKIIIDPCIASIGGIQAKVTKAQEEKEEQIKSARVLARGASQKMVNFVQEREMKKQEKKAQEKSLKSKNKKGSKWSTEEVNNKICLSPSLPNFLNPRPPKSEELVIESIPVPVFSDLDQWSKADWLIADDECLLMMRLGGTKRRHSLREEISEGSISKQLMGSYCEKIGKASLSMKSFFEKKVSDKTEDQKFSAVRNQHTETLKLFEKLKVAYEKLNSAISEFELKKQSLRLMTNSRDAVGEEYKLSKQKIDVIQNWISSIAEAASTIASAGEKSDDPDRRSRMEDYENRLNINVGNLTSATTLHKEIEDRYKKLKEEVELLSESVAEKNTETSALNLELNKSFDFVRKSFLETLSLYMEISGRG